MTAKLENEKTKMTAKLENEKTKESLTTSNELIVLKKDVAKEITDKLIEKNPKLKNSFKQGAAGNYLIDKDTPIDDFIDFMIGLLGNVFGLPIKTLKKYREMLTNADTKEKVEEVRNKILNELSKAEQTPQKEDEEKEQDNKKNPDNKEKVQDGYDKEKKTYTNSKSGLTFCIYDQCDPRRGNKRKNGGTTMRQTGCMLTSAAVIHSMIDPSITPEFYRQNYAGINLYKSIPEASNHKIEAKNLTIGHNTTKEMLDHLKKGFPINFMVHGPENGHNGRNPYTRGQHYRTAVDIRGENGKEEIFIANTYKGKGAGWYPADKMFISLREASLYTPTQA